MIFLEVFTQLYLAAKWEGNMAKKKSAKFNKEDIDNLSDDKPAVYIVEDKKKKNIYTGSAGKGRVKARVKEHLAGRKDSISGGVTVRIIQKSRIKDAQETEQKGSSLAVRMGVTLL